MNRQPTITADVIYRSLRLLDIICPRGWRGGDGGAASWGVGAVDGGSVNVFLAAALTRVMRATVPIPALEIVSQDLDI